MAKRKKQQISLFTIVSIILVIVAAFAITYYTTNKSSSKITFSNVSSIPHYLHQARVKHLIAINIKY